MSDLLQKISSYNLFNHLLPGIAFVVLLKNLVGISLIQTDIITGAFLYYFIGLIINIIGSNLIAPLSEKLKLFKLEPYENYIKAEKIDQKVSSLNEIAHMYRNIFTMLLIVAVLVLIKKLGWFVYFKKDSIQSIVVTVILGLIFLLAYRKQTHYVIKRVVNAANNSGGQP